MAAHEFDFVESPPEEFFCPVTFDLLQDPHQTRCCGNHLSLEAVTRLHQERGRCPLCNEINWSTVPDKFFKRKVAELKIWCSNKARGCEWVGALVNLDQHLKIGSIEGECLFVPVACPYSCGNRSALLRCLLSEHKLKECPKRPFVCKHCGHGDTYENINNRHLPACEKWPELCPNKCSKRPLQRQHLSNHLKEDCPLQEVECEFSYAGCDARVQRQYMPAHLKERAMFHLLLSSELIRKVPDLVEKVEQQHATIEQQERAIGQQQITIVQQQQVVEEQHSMLRMQQQTTEKLQQQLQQKLEQQDQIILLQQSQIDNLSSLLRHVHFAMPDIIMSSFKENKKARIVDWYSPPFYSHIGGYKLCLRVAANGIDAGEGTHVSVYIHLMQGEHDDKLQWPFNGEITIQLLCQKGNARHYLRKIFFDDRVGCNVTSKVSEHEIAKFGQGWPKFISHNELYQGYLKDDCLRFRVTSVNVNSV